MPTRDPAETLRRVLESNQQNLNTALPAKVKAFDAALHTVDVEPLIKNFIKDEEGELAESIGIIYKVPVQYPRCGKWLVAFPLAEGDMVQLVFNQRSIDLLFEKGTEVTPPDQRMHSLNGAVAYPGFYYKETAIKEDISADLVVGNDEGMVLRIKEDGTAHLSATAGTTQFVALANLVLARLQQLYDAIDGATPVAMDGGAALQTDIIAALDVDSFPESVASTKVKVEE